MTKNQIICAGGGVVINPSGQVLMIYRNGRWDFPKGKQEPEESIELCALREVCEECSLILSDLSIDKFITKTIHHYTFENTLVEKHTSWYAMSYSSHTVPTPQTIEGITLAQWHNPADIHALLHNSYPTIQQLYTTYLSLYPSLNPA